MFWKTTSLEQLKFHFFQSHRAVIKKALSRRRWYSTSNNIAFLIFSRNLINNFIDVVPNTSFHGLSSLTSLWVQWNFFLFVKQVKCTSSNLIGQKCMLQCIVPQDLSFAITHCMINVKRGQTMITTLKARFCCKTPPIHILLEAIDCILYGVTGMINACRMLMEDMRKSLSIESVFLITVFNRTNSWLIVKFCGRTFQRDGIL